MKYTLSKKPLVDSINVKPVHKGQCHCGAVQFSLKLDNGLDGCPGPPLPDCYHLLPGTAGGVARPGFSNICVVDAILQLTLGLPPAALSSTVAGFSTRLAHEIRQVSGLDPDSPITLQKHGRSCHPSSTLPTQSDPMHSKSSSPVAPQAATHTQDTASPFTAPSATGTTK